LMNEELKRIEAQKKKKIRKSSKKDWKKSTENKKGFHRNGRGE
jgi:hypothetical protein